MAAQPPGLRSTFRQTVDAGTTRLVRTAHSVWTRGANDPIARELKTRIQQFAENSPRLLRSAGRRLYATLLRWAKFLLSYGAAVRDRVRQRIQSSQLNESESRPAAIRHLAEIERPTGVTVIAIFTFIGAGILALGSFGFFFVAIMALTGGDVGDPVSASIAGMGVAGGFSLLVLAGVAGCLAVGVLELQEWARIVSIASIAVGIGCTIVSIFAFAGNAGVPVVPVVLGHVLVIGAAAWMIEYLARPGVRQAFRTATA
ncbi:MAG: hypothetical protein WB987_00355 [Candidatus Acidiferrales bacterium]